MSSLLLILGNGETRRLAVFGIAARLSRMHKSVLWYRFSLEEPDKLPEWDLDANIAALEVVKYNVIDLKGSAKPHIPRSRKREVFDREWEKIKMRVSREEAGIIVLEELDVLMDTGWLEESEIIELLRQAGGRPVVITATRIPAEIMSLANRVVEIWERDGGNPRKVFIEGAKP
ncbi:MAG: cob(I)yrinic acid a,c-diamide adenosyltransferase [Bacillota bacterium]